MKVILAPDSFKGSLPAAEVADALAEGWRRIFPEASLVHVPMADGGEGTVEAILAATGGQRILVTVTGPLGQPVQAAYAMLDDGTAAIEMAAASGYQLVPEDMRNPLLTTTRGTGELILHALGAGATKIIVGLGGSATNDGGAGAAQVLGASLRDAEGQELGPGGAALAGLAGIDRSQLHSSLHCPDSSLDETTRNRTLAQLILACDVDTPLCGSRGASHTFGPQKGATPGMVLELDAALHHYGSMIEQQFGVAVLSLPGGGAAGGLGAGLVAFAGGRLEPGVALVAEVVGLRDKLRDADLVLTGEGSLDAQSLHGKVPVGVARIAGEFGIPVIAFAGRLGPGYERLYARGITAAVSISPGPGTLEEAMGQTAQRLAEGAEMVARLWAARATYLG